MVAELLRGDVEEEGAVRWPAMAPALATAGFRTELRELLLRATERGVGAEQLAAWGRETGRDALGARRRVPGAVRGRHRILHAPGAVTRRATTRPSWSRPAIAELAGDAELLRQERERARWLFVDEYQDTDPAQVELLDLLAGGGGNLVAVGDPDQSIYAFRGAEPRGIVEFSDRFRHTDGAACRPGLARRVPALGGGAAARSPAGSPRGCPGRGSTGGWRGEGIEPGAAEVHVFSSAAVEAAYLADVLRRAHLLDGLPWSQMAVVVRTAAALGPLRRALASAGVPVAVSFRRPSAGRPAGRRPAAECSSPRCCRRPVRPRARTAGRGGRAGRRGVAGLTAGRRDGARPAPPPPRGPGRAGRAGGDRRRRAGRTAGHRESSDDGAAGVDVPEPVRAARAQRVGCGAGPPAGSALARGGTAEDVLWAMWQRSGLAPRGGRGPARPAGPRARSPTATSTPSWRCSTPPRGFVDRLPSADVRGVRRPPPRPGTARRLAGAARAVAAARPSRLLTAHASKGLEWDLVLRGRVQEGVWPDRRRARPRCWAPRTWSSAPQASMATAVDRRTLGPRRGTAAVLRGLHPGPPTAGRQRRRGRARRRRRRRDGVALPRPRRAAAGGRSACPPTCRARSPCMPW